MIKMNESYLPESENLQLFIQTVFFKLTAANLLL